MELGRDIRFMEKVSRETGVNIIAATGIYSYHYISPYFQNRSIDYMAELFVRDIEVGIQNTSIKAGFLKCATDRQGITPDVEKVIRAVARAHLKTGIPIMTHSHPASGTGIAQLDIFEDEGVNLNCVQIGHCGDTDNLEYLFHILERGAFIGMDRYGLPFDSSSPSTERKNDIVVELIDKGYIDRMFLSQDHCCAFDWFPPEAFEAVSDSPITYLFEVVYPNLRNRGITEEQIETMMCKNVQQWFNC
jgi:phosphotriesterase-related protein